MVMRPDPNEALRATRYSRLCGRAPLVGIVGPQKHHEGKGVAGRPFVLLSGAWRGTGLVVRAGPNEALRAMRCSRSCERSASGGDSWANETWGTGGGGWLVMVLGGVGMVMRPDPKEALQATR